MASTKNGSKASAKNGSKASTKNGKSAVETSKKQSKASAKNGKPAAVKASAKKDKPAPKIEREDGRPRDDFGNVVGTRANLINKYLSSLKKPVTGTEMAIALQKIMPGIQAIGAHLSTLRGLNGINKGGEKYLLKSDTSRSAVYWLKSQSGKPGFPKKGEGI